MPYRQAEAQASILRCWSPLLVPGVLQTESYMRAVLAVEPYTAGQLDELVAARLERQAVIGRAYLTAVIDQHVLHRLIGSAAVMAEQCAHLLSMAERPDIALWSPKARMWGCGVRLTSRHGTLRPQCVLRRWKT